MSKESNLIRNKKTGEIKEAVEISVWLNCEGTLKFTSLTDLNEQWEDYEPTKPLIKDEKIRKAVRAWWETVPDVLTDKRILYKKNQDLAVGIYSIYCGAIYPETLEEGKMYTITELCGEEE